MSRGKSKIVQRCVFVEGIGRCHVLSMGNRVDACVMDGPQDFVRASRAYDIITKQAPGRILWSVRFTEKGALQ